MIKFTDEEKAFLAEIAENKTMRTTLEKFTGILLKDFEQKLLKCSPNTNDLVHRKCEYDGALRMYNDINNIRQWVKQWNND